MSGQGPISGALGSSGIGESAQKGNAERAFKVIRKTGPESWKKKQRRWPLTAVFATENGGEIGGEPGS